jgi:hypothetical protein
MLSGAKRLLFLVEDKQKLSVAMIAGAEVLREFT